MPFYYRAGELPPKRHIQFRRPDGELYTEQLMGTKGFSGIESLLYHYHPPTQVKRFEAYAVSEADLEPTTAVRPRHFRTRQSQGGGNPIDGRQVLLSNDDLRIAIVAPTEAMPYFYRNGTGDELLFVHHGEGTLETIYGNLAYHEGDYLVIPIGTTYRVVPSSLETRMLVIEAAGAIEPPHRYRNEYGQLMEHSPYNERDIRVPGYTAPVIADGEFEVLVKAHGITTRCVFPFHPFDVVGWDGYLYPWALNIADFEPITGRIHQPPPVHQTFAGPNFVVCSFVPRKLDYHPQAIPAPYNHSNVESDEILYYVNDKFGSRRGIEMGSVTLHPSGIPHGPQPGAAEGSIGVERTEELAVMIDTFRPLRVAKWLTEIEDQGYPTSWLPTT